MGATMDFTVLGGGSILVAIIAYFLRKVDSKVDKTATTLEQFKTDVNEKLTSMREDIKEDMVEVFNNFCHERQGACSRLQEEKLKRVEATSRAACLKISRLESQRKEDWNEQKRWNERTEIRIINKNGGPSK